MNQCRACKTGFGPNLSKIYCDACVLAEQERAARAAISRHEAAHPGCNERYWYDRAMRAEQAAAHFFHCRECAEDGPCEEGKKHAGDLRLVV